MSAEVSLSDDGETDVQRDENMSDEASKDKKRLADDIHGQISDTDDTSSRSDERSQGKKRSADDGDSHTSDTEAAGSKRVKLDEDVVDVKSSGDDSQDGRKQPPVSNMDVDLNHKDAECVEDGDSDKENDGDAPMDLSTKPPGKSPDVITLSDSDSEDSAVHYAVDFVQLSPEEEAARNKLIRKLQTELRNEEAKLVLLKKIRQSQLASQQSTDISKASQRLGVSAAPLPVMRGGNHHPMTNGTKYMSSSHHSGRTSQVGPPPLVMAPRQQTTHQSLTSSQVPSYRQTQAPSQPPQPVQTPEQRQAAAKLALRKQLEKTLLQIPPPKPPPPEMNFIPSVGSNEFIMLVGLEEVVKRILDAEQGKPEMKYVFNPFTCCQCSTDFTPVWKRNKPGSKEVICEVCVTSNTKRALKQEHTNRLKSAFVKALQQEQEIEQRLNSQGSSSPSPATSSPVNLTSSYKPSAEQMRQHHNLIQAHQAQLRSLQGFQGANFPYQMSSSNLQRQFLLDMIPAWKK